MNDGFDHQDWKEIKFNGGKSSISENKLKKKLVDHHQNQNLKEK